MFIETSVGTTPFFNQMHLSMKVLVPNCLLFFTYIRGESSYPKKRVNQPNRMIYKLIRYDFIVLGLENIGRANISELKLTSEHIYIYIYMEVKLFMDAAQLAKLKECDLIKRKYSQFPGICPCIPLGCLQHPTDPQLGCLRTKQIQCPNNPFK